MNDSVAQIIRDVVQPPSIWELGMLFLGAGLTLGLLERLFPATPPDLLHRPGIAIDALYWLFTPLVTKSITTIALAIAACSAYALFGWPITGEAMKGFGPIAAQPTWLQAIELLIAADLTGYWVHRWFHVTPLWRFHAIHHSPKQLDWLSAYRMHPLNDALARIAQTLPLLLLGFSPLVIAGFVPFIVIYVVFLHANIGWTFGPFRHVLASPTFHRWHHTSEQEGIDRNYATLFPIWDVLFGTYYVPRRQPARYGVKDDSVPETFWGQMLYPFVTRVR